MLHTEAYKTVFDVPVQTIVNPVNCEGFMGKGLALEIKRRFPQAFRKYERSCVRGEMRIGTLQLVKTDPQWVLNFPSKEHWRQKSKMSYIEAGLRTFRATYKRRKITSIAFPPLGCGSGGLNWHDVRPVMEQYLDNLRDLDIYFCLGKPDRAKMQHYADTNYPNHTA